MMQHLRAAPQLSLQQLFDRVGAEDLLSHVGSKSTSAVPPRRLPADDFLAGRLPASVGTRAGYHGAGGGGGTSGSAAGELRAAGGSGSVQASAAEAKVEAVPEPPLQAGQASPTAAVRGGGGGAPAASPSRPPPPPLLLELPAHTRVESAAPRVIALACLALLVLLACAT